MTENEHKPQRLLKLTEVMARVGLAKTTIYFKVRTRSFPGPVSTGPNSSAWVESEIDSWIEDRISDRDQAA